MAKAHDVCVASIAIDTTHYTLIIAEEEDGESGDAVDEYQQRPLLVAMSHIILGHTVHDDSVSGDSKAKQARKMLFVR